MTGYGKTLILELIPFMKRKPVIIASPLNAILHQQKKVLGQRSIVLSSSFFSSSNPHLKLFNEGYYQ